MRDINLKSGHKNESEGDDYKEEYAIISYANSIENKSNEIQKIHLGKQKKWIYYVEERRREVAQMLAQGHSETEIAQLLYVHVSTRTTGKRDRIMGVTIH
jgi:DNA-binding NarL/FixJ family response regulator